MCMRAVSWNPPATARRLSEELFNFQSGINSFNFHTNAVKCLLESGMSLYNTSLTLVSFRIGVSIEIDICLCNCNNFYSVALCNLSRNVSMFLAKQPKTHARHNFARKPSLVPVHWQCANTAKVIILRDKLRNRMHLSYY